jgi:hypothetical protein
VLQRRQSARRTDRAQESGARDGARAQAEWKEIALNHLEGRTAAFFIYGDHAWDERDADGVPSTLHHKEYFDPDAGAGRQARDARALVWQCRFSGIEVPDDLWHYQRFGMGRKYSDNQAEDMARDAEFMQGLRRWAEPLRRLRRAKGRCPRPFRAYGYEPPGIAGPT